MKQQALELTSEFASDYFDVEPVDLRTIIQDCPELPCEVKIAEFTYVEQRLIDETLLHRLSCYQATDDGPSDWAIRLRRRAEALSSYLDKDLICVFVRMPGVQYTFEVDPERRSIVHWEWQVA